MITLSSRAAAQVRALSQERNASGQHLRLFVESGGCSGLQYGITFDQQKAGDSTFESEGLQLLIDAASLVQLDGSNIDFDDGLHGKGFEIKNPNARSTCGCGKSFN